MTEHNDEGSILVWTNDDGTEISFSEEATEEIQRRIRESKHEQEAISFEEVILEVLLDVTVPSLFEEELERREIHKLKEGIFDILNVQNDILEREHLFVDELISVRTEIIELTKTVSLNASLLEKHIKDSSRRKK